MFKTDSGQEGAATQEQIQHQAISAEQAADWAALQAGAAGAVTAPASQAQAEQGPPPPTEQAMGVAAMVIGAARPLLCHVVKGLDSAPDELWGPVTESTAGLLDHYGLARPELQGPWAKLAMSVLPLAGMVAIHRMQNPEPEDPPKSAIYQVPGAIPPPAPSQAEIDKAARAEAPAVGFHQ